MSQTDIKARCFQLIATAFEPTVERVLRVIETLPPEVDGVELRVDRLERSPSIDDFAAIRRRTPLPLIMTRRTTAQFGVPADAEIEAAMTAGFDWLDLEYSEELDSDLLRNYRDRAILSFHDFEGTPDLPPLLRRMERMGCARVKIATTPQGYGDNIRLLELLRSDRTGLTVTGMGARGLYARILAPFFGSELAFVAASPEALGAPGQLTCSDAALIYGENRCLQPPDNLFAVVGNPASHSRSPMIHNPRFRKAGASAAYAIIDTDSFDEVGNALRDGAAFAPRGVSITAPFKSAAFRFAVGNGAEMHPRAQRAGVVNTLIRRRDGSIYADNTDVEGFRAGLTAVGAARGQEAAVVGAGGTARAALVAAEDAGVRCVVFNRSSERVQELMGQFGAESRELGELASFQGSVILATLPSGAADAIPDELLSPGRALVDVAYGSGRGLAARARQAEMKVFDGLQFLEAQAVMQSEIFMKVAEKE